MPSLTFRVILTASLMISSAGAFAQTHLMGLGGQTCGAWTANRPSGGALGLLYQQWMFGFLSGVGYADPGHDPLDGMDATAVTAWLDDYCQDNAAARIADAAIAFALAHHR